MKKLKIGDRVKVIKPYGLIPLNAEGIIRKIYNPIVGVEWFKFQKRPGEHAALHTLSDIIKLRRGYYILPQNIELIPRTPVLKTLARIQKKILKRVESQ